jgi:hypothetical protein
MTEHIEVSVVDWHLAQSGSAIFISWELPVRCTVANRCRLRPLLSGTSLLNFKARRGVETNQDSESEAVCVGVKM